MELSFYIEKHLYRGCRRSMIKKTGYYYNTIKFAHFAKKKSNILLLSGDIEFKSE